MKPPMKTLYVEAVGLAAPGLDGWDAGAAVLRGECAWLATELPLHAPALLPPNERRRAPPAVRLAFRVAEEVIARSKLPAADLASVFASSDADTQVLHRICTALAEPGRVVSPTDFHNSVHNAAPGYWSIAVGSRAPSVSLSAWDASFVAGLLEAASLVHVDDYAVLLVVYDLRPPSPLDAARAIIVPSALSLILTAQPTASALACLHVRIGEGSETAMLDTDLEALRLAGTALRALPLLRLIARREAGSVVLAGAGVQRIVVDVRPC